MKQWSAELGDPVVHVKWLLSVLIGPRWEKLLETYMASGLFQHQLLMEAMCCTSRVNRDLSNIQVMSDEQIDGGHF